MKDSTKKIVGKTVGVTGTVVSHVFSLALKVVGTALIIMVTTGLILTSLFVAYVEKSIKPYVDLKLDDFQLNLTSFVYCYDPVTGEKKKNLKN